MSPSEFNDRFDYDPDHDLLGEGGFGKIFKAWDNVRNEFIALKMARVQPELEAFSLLRECERVKNLEHPNIARYMDCQRIKLPGIGTHDIAQMKYYELGNLTQLLQNHVITQFQKQKLIEGLLEGIFYLHHQKPMIIHSDLKPSNILVVERRGLYIPLITDFGISRLAKSDDKSYVTNFAGAGTYAYAAPEQWEARELRPNADLWSFGILLIYIWFNGKKLPFRSDDISIATEAGRLEYMKRVIALDFIPDLKDLPTPYRNAIDICLVIDPAKRVKSASDIKLTVAEKHNNQADEATVTMGGNGYAGGDIFQMAQEKTQLLSKEEEIAVTQFFTPPPPPEAESPAARPQKTGYKKTILATTALATAALLALGYYAKEKKPAPGTQPAKDTASMIQSAVSSTAAAPAPVKLRPEVTERPTEKISTSEAQIAEERKLARKVFEKTEEDPSFPNGQEAMQNWLDNNLRKPADAGTGTVLLSFIVNADGSRESIRVTKGVSTELDEEAKRLVRTMPRWIPGRNNGKAVRVHHEIAIAIF